MAQGRESSRVAQIKVLDLALHPGLSPTDLASLSPDRRYRYEIERSKLELQVEQAMQKKYDVTMDERLSSARRLRFPTTPTTRCSRSASETTATTPLLWGSQVAIMMAPGHTTCR